MSPVLQVENLVLGYERYDAVKGISLHVNAGSVVTLIGANGAGKTTTLRGLSPRCPPTRLPGLALRKCRRGGKFMPA